LTPCHTYGGAGRSSRPHDRHRNVLFMTRTRAILFAAAGLLILVLSVIEAVDRGSSFWNIASIVIGAFLLLYGVIAARRTSH
jgi:hypothetical protein